MNRTLSQLLVGCVVLAVEAVAAQCAPITVPGGLHSGDQYRLIFVTSTTTWTVGPSDASDFVNQVANSVPELAALNTTWRVIASTDAGSAIANSLTYPGGNPDLPIYSLANSLLTPAS